jgi:hypothetical protein
MEEKTNFIGIYLPDYVAKWVREDAARQGLTITAYMRRLMQKVWREH